MPDAHSLYSASAAERWLSCPGSLALTRKLPSAPSSIYAAEGTAAHGLAEMCLRTARDADAFIGQTLQADGFEFEVDDDFAAYVQTYLDIVREYADGAEWVGYEQQVHYHTDIGVDEGKAFGTSDFMALKGKLLIVADLKFGRGKKVTPDENPQLILYALGALNHVANDQILSELATPERVLMVISQPRVVAKPLEWEISVEELLERAEGMRLGAERTIDAMLEKGAKGWYEKFTFATEDGCRYCKALATCPTARAGVSQATFGAEAATPDAFAAFDIVKPTEAQDADWLLAAFDRLEQIEDWCNAVRAEIDRRLLAGEPVGNLKMVAGKRGARKWTDVAEAENAFKAMRLKHDQMYNYKVISPTQAEKLAVVSKKDAAAGVKPALGDRQWKKLQALITQSEGKPHVARADDERPAIQVTPVRDTFDDIPDDPVGVDDLL